MAHARHGTRKAWHTQGMAHARHGALVCCHFKGPSAIRKGKKRKGRGYTAVPTKAAELKQKRCL
eukprot:1150049-Pelagomonas_calceolata.AAC.11